MLLAETEIKLELKLFRVKWIGNKTGIKMWIKISRSRRRSVGTKLDDINIRDASDDRFMSRDVTYYVTSRVNVDHPRDRGDGSKLSMRSPWFIGFQLSPTSILRAVYTRVLASCHAPARSNVYRPQISCVGPDTTKYSINIYYNNKWRQYSIVTRKSSHRVPYL